MAHILDGENASSRKSKTGKGLSASFNHPTLSAIAQTSCSALPRLASLISKPEIAFSDTLVIQSVYLVIAPLFVNEPLRKKVKGKDNASGREAGLAVLKSLRMESLGCLRGVSPSSSR